MVDINSKINSYYKHMQRHFQSHGRTKDFVGHSSKVFTFVLIISLCCIVFYFNITEFIHSFGFFSFIHLFVRSFVIASFSVLIKSLSEISNLFQVHSVGWSCGGRNLASCSFDKTVSIYTLEKERLVSTSN